MLASVCNQLFEPFRFQRSDSQQRHGPWLGGRLVRFPFIAQRDQTDCGAACLAMIAAWHGVGISIVRLRDMAHVGPHGTTFWSLAQAAEALGFEVRGLELDVESLPDLRLPVILHYEGNHYVVLYAISREHVVISDPARGRVRLGINEFCDRWNGRALEMVPTPRLQRGGEVARGSWRRYLGILGRLKGWMAAVLSASLLLSLLGLGIPLFVQVIVDRVLLQHSAGSLHLLFAGMLILALFQTFIRSVRQVLVVHIANRFDAQVMSDFSRHLFALPLRYFERRRVGDVVSRMMENQKVRAALTGTIPGVLLDLIAAAACFALLSCYDLKMTLLVAAVALLLGVLTLAFTPIIRSKEREEFDKRTEASAYLIESLTGIGTVKALGLEPEAYSKLNSLIADSLAVARTCAHVSVGYESLAGWAQGIGAALFLWYGACQVLAGELTTGQLMAFIMIAANAVGPLLNVVRAWQGLQDARNALDRLDDVH